MVVDDRPATQSADAGRTPTERLRDCIDLDRLVSEATPRQLCPRELNPYGPAVVMATSGTTGPVEAKLLPHFAGVRQARRVTSTIAYGPADVLLNLFPWNHINVRHAGLFAETTSSARLVVDIQFSASRFWDLCRAEGDSAFNFMVR